MHVVCESRHLQTLHALLATKTRTDVKNSQGATRIYRAAERDHKDVVKILQTYDADAYASASDDSNYTPIDEGDYGIVKRLEAGKAYDL